MAYASISGRARVSAKKPSAFGVCDRCGTWYNHNDLRWQMDWRGPTIQNLRILVCNRCYDRPQEQQRAIVLPADPTPIINARTENFLIDESDFRTVSYATVLDPVTGIPIPSTALRVTEDCENRTLYPFGRPVGLNQNAVMPYNGQLQKHLGVPLSLLSVSCDGTCTVTVTCSAVHGLQNSEPIGDGVTGPSQVSVEGLSNVAACGFYSVNVVTATMFTYQLYAPILAQALLTPTTRIITALVGLPRGYKRIPKLYGPTVLPEVEVLICFLETEDGTGVFALEDGSGFIQLEQCMQPPLSDFFFELESGLGDILLENGVDFLEQEDGP
jgi:hypothetical protein